MSLLVGQCHTTSSPISPKTAIFGQKVVKIHVNVNMPLSVLNVHESPEFLCNKETGVQVYDGDI